MHLVWFKVVSHTNRIESTDSCGVDVVELEASIREGHENSFEESKNINHITTNLVNLYATKLN